MDKILGILLASLIAVSPFAVSAETFVYVELD